MTGQLTALRRCSRDRRAGLMPNRLARIHGPAMLQHLGLIPALRTLPRIFIHRVRKIQRGQMSVQAANQTVLRRVTGNTSGALGATPYHAFSLIRIPWRQGMTPLDEAP